MLAINNRNGLNALKTVNKIEIFEIKYILLHPKNKIKFHDEIISEITDKSIILYWEKSNRTEIQKKAQNEGLDLLLSVNFGYIFKHNFLECFKEKINLHTSYLPYNRGAHPNVWPIIDGTPAGVTLHTMDAEIDKGKIIYQEEVKVEETDTGKTLYEKLEERSVEVFRKGLVGYYHNEIVPFIPKEVGTYHSHQDFVDLFEVDLNEKIKTGDFLRRLRALSFPPFKNAYYQTTENEKINIDISIARKKE